MPGGVWEVRVFYSRSDAQLGAQPATHFPLVIQPAAIANAGVIRLNGGSIRGRVTFLNPADLASAVVAVPEQGKVTQPNAGGVYLLQDVAVGLRQVMLLHSRYGQAPPRQSVLVKARQTVDGPDFIRRRPAGAPSVLDFGLVVINSPRRLVWKLWPEEGVPATVNAISISGPDAAKFQRDILPAFPIPVGPAGVEVPVTVDASALGTFTAELGVDLEADGVGFTEVATLRAVVTPPPTVPLPDPRFVPAELDFGAMPGIDTRSVELRNDGDGAGTAQVAGPLGPFQLVSPTFPLTLPARSSRTVTVRAVPPGSPGPAVAFLKLICEPGHRALELRVSAVWS
jgi:hypothetical protein